MVDRAARLRPGDRDVHRMLAGGAVLADRGARALRGAARLDRRIVADRGAIGLGIQSWLLAYAMTRVGGALPALVLGLEPIVIGLVGSLVVREHVSPRLCVAFAVGLAGEVVIAGFVTRRPRRSGRCCRCSPWSASSRCSRPTASRCRQLAALPSAPVVCVALARRRGRGRRRSCSSRSCAAMRCEALHPGTSSALAVRVARRGRARLAGLGARCSRGCARRSPRSASTSCRSAARSRRTSASTSRSTPATPSAR